MDSDLNDIQKIENALGANRDNDSLVEYQIRCDSADGYSVASSYQQHLTPQADNSFSIFEELTSESLDEDGLVIDQLEPSLDNALCLNKAYQSMLMELSQQLDVLRIVNRQKQKDVLEEIEALTAQTNKKTEKTKRTKINISFFGMPYFKDWEYSCAPKNEDAQLAENIGFRNISLINTFKPFSKFETRRLRLSLKEQALTIEANRLMRQREELQNKLAFAHSTFVSDDEKKALENQIELIQRQIYDVNSLPENKLFDISPTMFDWQKIAVVNFRRSRTSDQLRLHWIHYISPNVNCRAWTATENRKLKECVKIYKNGIDWEEVAVSLNSNRMPFECFRRYQERLNPQHRKFGWTKLDNKKFLKIISTYKDKTLSDIDWEDVRNCFPGRSKTQIYAHFRYHTQMLNPNPFTPSEDVVILEGIKMGYDFSDISLLLGKRSTAQIRNRYKIIEKKGKGLERNWTEKENNMLLAMKETNQLKAYVIRKNFPGRTFAQLFSRFHYLRMKLTTPQKYIDDLKEKTRSTRKSFFPKDNKAVGRKLASILSQFQSDRKRNNCLKKTIPRLKSDLLGKNAAKLQRNARIGRPMKVKRTVARKEKQLKEILRPLIATTTKRPRKLCFPGDGRQHGIVLASLYRLLQCNFTLAPKEELSTEEIEEIGIAPQHVLAFANLMTLTKDLVQPNVALAPETILCLPPTLSTLTGFRGLLLHRKYLQSSASCDYSPSSSSVTTPVPHDLTKENTNQSVTREVLERTDGENVSVPTTVDDNADLPEITSQINQEDPPTESGQEEGSQSLIILESEEVVVDNNAIQSSALVSESDVTCAVNDPTHRDEPISEHEEMDIGDDTIDETMPVDEETLFESEEEEEEHNEEQIFGDRVADSLLLSRLLTLFYWPGIMSTMHIPDTLVESMKLNQKATHEEVDPLSLDEPSQTPTKTPVKTPKSTKKEMKKRRRAHIQSVVRRRFGKPDPVETSSEQSENVVASTSTEASGETEVVATPEKTPKKKPRKAPVPQSDRVTRTRRSRGAPDS